MTAHVSPVRRVMGRSLSALRKLNDDQVYAWERYLRAGMPARTGEPTARQRHGHHGLSGSGSR